ncbi:GNAT family N-acetyltransferase [Thalassotalea fusca]
MPDNQVLAEVIMSLNHATERLILRRFNEADIPLEIEHERNPEIMKYIADIDYSDELEQRVLGFIGPWSAEEGVWTSLAVSLPNTTDFIGMVCLRFESVDYCRIEIGYRFHPDFHGKGYAFEAVSALLGIVKRTIKVNKFLAYCVAENHASSRLMEKLGMEQEGLLRRHSTLNGQWHDEMVFGLLVD